MTCYVYMQSPVAFFPRRPLCFLALSLTLAPLILSACGAKSTVPLNQKMELRKRTAPIKTPVPTPVAPVNSATSLQNSPKIAVALYSYPIQRANTISSTWQDVVKAQAQTQQIGFVVVNVSDGPIGSVEDQANYLKGIDYLKNGGVMPYGYIDTAYATRALDTLKAEADLWISKFGVRSFFLDQVKQGCSASTQNYYAGLSSYLRSKGADVRVVLNPGAASTKDECLMTYSDVLVTFEDSGDSYLRTEPPTWTKQYAPQRFWNMAYSVGTEAQQNQIIALARQRGAGYLSVTSAPSSDPYSTTSALWPSLLAALSNNSSLASKFSLTNLFQ